MAVVLYAFAEDGPHRHGPVRIETSTASEAVREAAVAGALHEADRGPKVAAVREVLEESGLELADVETLRCWSHHATYLGYVSADAEAIVSHEHSGARWTTVADYRNHLSSVAESQDEAPTGFALQVRGCRSALPEESALRLVPTAEGLRTGDVQLDATVAGKPAAVARNPQTSALAHSGPPATIVLCVASRAIASSQTR